MPDTLRYKLISYGLRWNMWLLWEDQNKTLIYNKHIKTMTHRNFLLQKENYCKVQLRFIKCCTLVTEGYHVLVSPLNRLVTCYFIKSRSISVEPAGNISSGKGSVVSINQAGGSEPLRRELRGQSPLRKFSDSKEYLEWFNNTGKICFAQFSTRIY